MPTTSTSARRGTRRWGQTCRQRGGCFNCSAGEYDSDGIPTHPCEKCPEGKTSEEGVAKCTEVDPSLWEMFTSLDEAQLGAIGVALILISICSNTPILISICPVLAFRLIGSQV